MNCERFHDQMFDLLSGGLNSTEAGAMLEHSSQCTECDAVLALEESLQTDRAEGVIETVPESWIASMWPAVMAEIATGRAQVSASRVMPVWGWARCAIAALLSVCLVGTGYLLGQRVSSNDEPGARVPRAEASETIDTRSPLKLTLADVLAALDRLPDGTTLMSSDEAEELIRKSLPLRRLAFTSPVGLDLSDGVQVGELRAVLDELPRDGSMELPASLGAEELRWWLRRRA